MKKILMILIMLACFAGSVGAGLVYGPDFYLKNKRTAFSGSSNDPLYRFMVEVDAELGGNTTGDATIYHVNSNVATEGDGTSWTNARDTLDEAINLCSAGDFIYVAEGHAESGSAAALWDADVAGITIVHFGNGSRMGTYTFADTDTTVVLGAADVTVYGGRFLAGKSEVVMGISVEAGADDCALIGCEFPEPATSTFEFDKAILLATGADRLTVAGCTYYNCDATGATNFIDLDTGIVNGMQIVGNYIYGEFAEGAIHTDKVCLEMLIKDNVIVNMTSGQHGIEITANATGLLINNLVSTDAIGTSYDIGHLNEQDNYWDDYNTYDTMAVPWTTNETGVNRWGVTELAQIEGEATDAIEADHLDHLFAVSVADEIADSSVWADLVSADATSDWSDYDNTTMSLEALNVDLDAILADTAEIQPIAEKATSKSLTPIASGDLFAVAGGPIKITEIIGVVTDTVQTQANSIKLLIDPTAPATDTDICAALEINADAIGTVYTITGTFANAMVESTNGVVAGLATEIICPIGMIELHGTASNTGTIVWYIRYVPLSTASTVTAQ